MKTPLRQPDPMAAPFVEATVDTLDGPVRLHSSKHEEALWIGATARVTPSQARALAALLTRYADTHESDPDAPTEPT